ncbi:cytochrome P450 2L1-like [Oratosquilla oratoria]|uniref:cytochrome P450 2L1-like n=1 Tax=Oratosquilla oratoria TaxID=337810 RepID=UPI003F760C76
MWFEVILGVLLLCALWYSCKKPQGLPPGLWGFPLVGHPSWSPVPKEQELCQLWKKHGDIFSVRTGSVVQVFLCNYDLVKEACSRFEFSDRPLLTIFTVMSDNLLGIVGSSGPVWQNGRRFCLQHLQRLGMGKSSIEGSIQFEASEFAKYIEERAGVMEIPNVINVATVNIIWQLVAGKRYTIEDPHILSFQKIIEEFEVIQGTITITEFFTWIPKVFPNWILDTFFGFKELKKIQENMRTFIKAIIDEHKENFDPENPRDFTDAYLLEMETKKDDPKNTFSDEDLGTTLFDLFVSGSETVSKTIRWFLLYMASYPEIQEKVQKEVDDVIPRDMQPSWEDKNKMPFTEAVISEVHRHASVVSMGIQHFTSRETSLSGFRIPKGAVVYPVLKYCHWNSKVWDHPEEFQPERFVDDNGEFCNRKEGLLPFGLGRRQCLGESLGRMEVFIFVTTLMQRISVAPGPDKVDLRPHDYPLFNFPRPQKLTLTARK